MASAKKVQLLLTETVDNLGIVGDVVKVRSGYARNYLLPFGYATEPSDELLGQLKTKRAEAQKRLADLRSSRETLIGKLQGLDMTMVRACNDQGQLYGSVTQQDIASALTDLGFAVKPREVRLSQTIKRIDNFDVLVKFDTDLEAHVRLHVAADRQMEAERVEMEFDNEGELIEPGSRRARDLAAKDAERQARREARKAEAAGGAPAAVMPESKPEKGGDKKGDKKPAKAKG